MVGGYGICVCDGRVRPLSGQFVILRGNTVNDAGTRVLPIWAYFKIGEECMWGGGDRANLLLKKKFY